MAVRTTGLAIAALAVAVLAVGCNKKEPASPNPPQAQAPPRVAPAPLQLSGTVAQASNDSVTVQTAEGRQVPLRVTGSTTVSLNGQPSKADQLPVGAAVRATAQGGSEGVTALNLAATSAGGAGGAAPGQPGATGTPPPAGGAAPGAPAGGAPPGGAAGTPPPTPPAGSGTPGR